MEVFGALFLFASGRFMNRLQLLLKTNKKLEIKVLKDKSDIPRGMFNVNRLIAKKIILKDIALHSILKENIKEIFEKVI